MQNQIRRRRAVCLNDRKLRLNETVFSSSSGPFSQPALRDNRPTSAVSALIIIIFIFYFLFIYYYYYFMAIFNLVGVDLYDLIT